MVAVFPRVRLRCLQGLSGVTGFTGVRPGCRWIYPRLLSSIRCAMVLVDHPWLLDSLGYTLVAVGFIKGRRVHWSTPWGPSGSSGVAGFTGVRPGGRLVHPLSFGCAVVIVWFIRGGWIHWSAPWGSSGSSGSLGTLWCVLEIVVFIQGSWFHWGCALGVIGFIRVHPRSLGSLRVGTGGSRFHPCSQDTLVCALGVVGFIRDHWVHWRAPGKLSVHPGSLKSLGCVLAFVGFIRSRLVHGDAPLGPSGSSGVVGFTGVRPWCRWVHPGSLGSLGCALGAIVLIWGHWVH